MSELVFNVLCAAILLACLLSLEARKFEKSPGEGLFLTPIIRNGSTAEARNLSIVDNSLLLGINSYAGYITVDEENQSNIFFWYFPHDDSKQVPWIIWLNGGPGTSSMFGLFDQVGPIMIENGTVKKRNNSWASDYSLLFIDSPVGTGFSFTENDSRYATNMHEVSNQLYLFLMQFLDIFPELIDVPLFIAGESYAGKYVPEFALHIHNNKDMRRPIQLKGISLGNPLIDPRNTMFYSELVGDLGLLQDDNIVELKILENLTMELSDQGRLVDAANKFNDTIEYIKKKTGVDIFNYIKDPSDISNDFEKYLTQPEIRQLIHVGNATFNLNNPLVYEKMLADFMNSSKHIIEKLLDSYGVLCYHGQMDLFMPYSAAKRVYDQMQWNGRELFLKAPRRRVKHHPRERIVAYKKAGGHFEEIMIRGCGHNVLKEEPELVKFINDRFISTFSN